jgi:hypothetical protein
MEVWLDCYNKDRYQIYFWNGVEIKFRMYKG